MYFFICLFISQNSKLGKILLNGFFRAIYIKNRIGNTAKNIPSILPELQGDSRTSGILSALMLFSAAESTYYMYRG